MGNPAKEDVETIEDDDPRSQWPKSAKACSITGLTKRTLENKVRSGEAKYVYDSSGDRHFDPEWLDSLNGTVTEKAIEADMTQAVMSDLRKALADMTKANAALLNLATVPAFKAGKLVRAENRALRKRCRQLEEDRVKAIEAFEAALTESHERELARMAATSHQSRLDKGFNALLDQLPNMVNQLSFKKTINDLLGSLSGEQKSVLFELLTPEQLQKLGRIMKQGDSDEKRSPPAKPSDTANGAPSPKAESKGEAS